MDQNNRRVQLSRPCTVEDENKSFDREELSNRRLEHQDTSDIPASESHLKLPPINKTAISPEPEIVRRTPNALGPPINRAQALRFHKIRRDMTDYAEAPYLPRRFRNSKHSQYGTGSLDSSLSRPYGISGAFSPAPSRVSHRSRMSESQFSAVHPLSIKSHEDIYGGKTKWTKTRITSKVGSLDNYHHVPGGGDKDVHEIQYHFNAPNAISSQTKIVYGPKRSKALHRRLEFDSDHFERLPNLRFKPKNVQSKCGSLDNIGHRPGGGTKAIFTERMPRQDGFKHRR